MDSTLRVLSRSDSGLTACRDSYASCALSGSGHRECENSVAKIEFTMPVLSTSTLLQRIDAVLTKHSALQFHAGGPGLTRDSAGAFRASGLTLLKELFGPAHHHYVDFDKVTRQYPTSHDYQQAKAIIQIVREEVEAGWLANTRGLIAGEVFADFLEMAQHLWDEGYKDAAAVIAGSSLEAHLKRLCGVNGIDVEVTNAKGDLVVKKADTLNADLVKADIYNKTEQKQVTAWLGVRNDAAHGDYSKVISDVVGAMIHGIRMFIGRYPA